MYTVCPLVFEFSIQYNLDLKFFCEFEDENFEFCRLLFGSFRLKMCR